LFERPASLFEVRGVDFVLKLNSDTVAEAMSAQPVCIDPHQPVREVLTLLKQHHAGGALVCRDGRLVGIFTERDALRLMAAGATLDAAVETVMVPQPVSLRAGDSIAKAIRTMSVGGYRRLPVIDDHGAPVGLLNVANIVHYLVEHFPQAVYNLPPDSQSLMPEREGA
jgi:CBS domain-containing protein